VLKVGGKMNLFAVFPIGATIQDGGKRKRSDVTYFFMIQEIKENINININKI